MPGAVHIPQQSPLGLFPFLSMPAHKLPTPASRCQRAVLRLQGCSVHTDSSECLGIYDPLGTITDSSGGINMGLLVPVQDSVGMTLLDSTAPPAGQNKDYPVGYLDTIPLLLLASI